jgi:hypothetical protein
MVRRFYAMKDDQSSQDEPVLVNENELQRYNSFKYGIFQEVNSFSGRRLKENVSRINFWYAEIDGGDKKRQIEKIRSLPLYPTLVNESKNGFHIYFEAKDASVDGYKVIQDGIGSFLGGDPRVRDISRILRAPGFYHWKDENDPFKVKTVFKIDVAYLEKEMLYFFPLPKEEPKEETRHVPSNYHYVGEDNLTTFLDSLNHEIALQKLSGSLYVNGEIYTFKPVSMNRKNIIVNGKSTNCFIDEDKRIGAVPGGPTIYQWLKYFGHSDKNVYQIIKEVLWT